MGTFNPTAEAIALMELDVVEVVEVVAVGRVEIEGDIIVSRFSCIVLAGVDAIDVDGVSLTIEEGEAVVDVFVIETVCAMAVDAEVAGLAEEDGRVVFAVEFDAGAFAHVVGAVGYVGFSGASLAMAIATTLQKPLMENFSWSPSFCRYVRISWFARI